MNLSQSMGVLLFSHPTRVRARIKPNPLLDLQWVSTKALINLLGFGSWEMLALYNCSAGLLFRPGYRLANICKREKKKKKKRNLYGNDFLNQFSIFYFFLFSFWRRKRKTISKWVQLKETAPKAELFMQMEFRLDKSLQFPIPRLEMCLLSLFGLWLFAASPGGAETDLWHSRKAVPALTVALPGFLRCCSVLTLPPFKFILVRKFQKIPLLVTVEGEPRSFFGFCSHLNV